jgi:hypothetical protein
MAQKPTPVPLEQAKKWTAAYREFVKPYNEGSKSLENLNFPYAFLIPREELETLLDYATNVRMYFGRDENDNTCALIVGTDKENNDILINPNVQLKQNGGETDDNSGVYNHMQPCPNLCSKPPILGPGN